METVTSAAGIPIAFDRSGAGPALIIVAGAFCTRLTFKPLAALLAPRFTVFEYDRRGRGDSGDSDTYSVQGEIDDLAAVIDAAGGSAYVYGHSSGAVLSLEAAAQGLPIRGLVVYEPPLMWSTGLSEELPTTFHDLAASGRGEEAAELFMLNTGAPQAAIDATKSAPFWPAMVAIAHTLEYDQTLVTVGSRSTTWLETISTPVLAVAGGTSAPWAAAAAETISKVAPRASWTTLPGQDHNVAPDVIAPVLAAAFR